MVSGKRLKAATWNVSEGVSALWNLGNGIGKMSEYEETKLVQQIVEKINEIGLDILCLQEFPIKAGGHEVVKELILAETEMKYYSFFTTSLSFLFAGGEIGVAI